jgi:hypothetical protein
MGPSGIANNALDDGREDEEPAGEEGDIAK